jgi:hypothetical protein
LRHQDQKPVGLEQQQDGPVPAPNKFPLPLPLAVRDNTSVFYKQNDVIAKVNKADTAIDSQKVMKQNMQHNVADIEEAKVMRRDILASDQNGFKTNDKKESGRVNSEIDAVIKTKQGDILSNSVSNGKLSDGKSEGHEREKRDTLTEELEHTFLVASMMHKEKNKQEPSDVKQGDMSENCEASRKANKIGDSGLSMAMFSKNKHSIAGDHPEHTRDQEHPPISEKRSASPQMSDLGTASHAEKIPDLLVETTESASDGSTQHSITNANTSSTYTGVSGKQNLEGIILNELKTQKNAEDRALSGQEDVSTSNYMIKTPLHLSEPKLNNDGMKLLSEAVMEAKDVSVVAKPMTRDLKSISAVQQMHEDNEHNEKKHT